MLVRRTEPDSTVLGRAVLDAAGLDPADDLAAAEAAWIRDHHPRYVMFRLPVEDLAAAHRLEQAGFRYVETQLRLTYRLKPAYDTAAFPYRHERVTREEDLAPVLDIASSTFTVDRIGIDPGLPEAAAFSAARYRAYVRKSLASPDERLYRLVDNATGRVLAFKTHRLLGPGEALMLLGGVHPDYKDAGLASISAYFQYNSLREEGVRRITTHVSARNIPTLNIEVSGLQYRIAAVFTIFRKLYD